MTDDQLNSWCDPEGRGSSGQVASVYFATDSDTLDQQDRGEIQKLQSRFSMIMLAHRIHFWCIGHTDHIPPGTSKWNRIEHRLFSFITLNWRGKPLHDYRMVVELIGDTKTQEGLEVHCELDQNTYEKGRKVTEEEMASINLYPNRFHGEWNYMIKPRE